jgi:membrane-bound lytic murein transglycosylase B
MKTFSLVLILSLVASSLAQSFLQNSSARQSPYWRTPKYRPLIRQLEEIGYSGREIDSLFSFSKLYPQIYKKYSSSKKKKKASYNPYLNFLRTESIREGRQFLRSHWVFLSSVESRYGIPKEVIVALLRIESHLGKNKGKYQVFGVFNSMIYYGEARDSLKIKRAEKELISFLILCSLLGKNPLEVKGSWAGALGIPQFMPSSYLNFSVDGDGDGEIDLFDNKEDAISSIANYLKIHGWEEDSAKAIYHYNHSSKYVKAILQYAKKLKE